MMCRKRCTVFALVGIISGLICILIFPMMYDAVLKGQMAVLPGSLSYDIWKELPVPMYMNVYFFNITNSREIEARVPGEKPRLQQLGPYVFREKHFKTKQKWDENQDTVQFQQIKSWSFVPERSKGRLDDEITTINVVALATAEYSRHRQVFYASVLDDFLTAINTSMFLTHTVANFTFDGIYDDILRSVAEGFSHHISIPIPFDKFGWFYPRNNSPDYDGTLSMFTGRAGIHQIGQIISWNNQSHVDPDIYPEHCGRLNGSAGDFFPPHREKTFVDLFSPDLCRSIRFRYANEELVSNVNGYKFVLDESIMASSLAASENWCFNAHPAPDLELPAGLMNVSSCKFGAPAYVSFPHFFLADQMLLRQFPPGTLSPDKSRHESYLILEPVSGVPLDVTIRLQINVLVRPIRTTDDGFNYANISLYDELEPIFYPMIWFETYTELEPGMRRLMNILGVAPKLGQWIGIGIIALGCLVLSVSLVLRIRDSIGRRFSHHHGDCSQE